MLLSSVTLSFLSLHYSVILMMIHLIQTSNNLISFSYANITSRIRSFIAALTMGRSYSTSARGSQLHFISTQQHHSLELHI